MTVALFASLLLFFTLSSIQIMQNDNIECLLRQYAQRYETKDFLPEDPSWFMHQIEGDDNKEALAFVASCLSYGNRKQFMPKIQSIADMAEGNVYRWIKEGDFKKGIPDDDRTCFYRLYTQHTMHTLLCALQSLLAEYGSIGNFIKNNSSDGLSAIKAITAYFSSKGIETIIPKNTISACKRICMFLRWMSRDNSPVDLGLWSSFIDKRTLIIPMDTHVMQQANRLGLITSKTTSMSTAIKLTQKLSEIFPDDPLKGDFALFGYGVNNK